MDRSKVKKRLVFWYAFFWFLLIYALYQSYGVYFLDLTSTKSKWVGLFAGSIALLLASLKFCETTLLILKNTIFKQIYNYFQSGNFVVNYKINRYAFIVGSLISILVFRTLGFPFILCLFAGLISTMIMNFINDFIYNYSAVKSKLFLEEAVSKSCKINLFAAISTAFVTIAFSIVPIVILYHIFKDYQIIYGYVLGGALIFVCSAINYIITKFSLYNTEEPLGKSFEGLTLFDKRNPLLLLNGLCKGVLNSRYYLNNIYISYGIGLVSAITIGALCLNLMGAFLPIIILSNGIFASIIAILIINFNAQEQIKSLYLMLPVYLVIFTSLTYWTIHTWLLQEGSGLIYSTVLGAILACVHCCLNAKSILGTKIFREIINSASLGQYSAWVQTIKASFKGVFTSTLFLILSILFAFLLPKGIEAPLVGIYGISLCVCGYLSICIVFSVIQSYAILAKNSIEIPQTYEKELVDIKDVDTNSLTMIVQKIFSINKNYSSIATILSSLSAFIAYTLVCYIEEIDILNPYILANLIFGSIFGLLFASKLFTMSTKNALKLIIEAKRQFRKTSQILEYQELPNYKKPIKLLLDNNIIQITGLLILFFVILYLDLRFLKYEAIAGCLFAIILTGYFVSIFTGNLANNAKNALVFFENNYYQTKEHSIIENVKKITQIPYGLISGAYDILIKFMAIVLLSIAIMFV